MLHKRLIFIALLVASVGIVTASTKPNEKKGFLHRAFKVAGPLFVSKTLKSKNVAEPLPKPTYEIIRNYAENFEAAYNIGRELLITEKNVVKDGIASIVDDRTGNGEVRFVTPGLVGMFAFKDNEVIISFAGSGGVEKQNQVFNFFRKTPKLKLPSSKPQTKEDVNEDSMEINEPMLPKTTKNTKGIQIHAGVWNHFSKFLKLNIVKQYISNKEIGNKKVTIVGHSLGGAQSQLMAWYMCILMPEKDIEVITYGAPRVGNPTFVKFMLKECPKVRHYRVVADDDWVPHTPHFGRYLHYGQEIFYTAVEQDEYRISKVKAVVFPPQNEVQPTEEKHGSFKHENTQLFANGGPHNKYGQYVCADLVDMDNEKTN